MLWVTTLSVETEKEFASVDTGGSFSDFHNFGILVKYYEILILCRGERAQMLKFFLKAPV